MPIEPPRPDPRRRVDTAVERDREMRCTSCGTRVFTSRAAVLVASHYRCPRCSSDVQLVSADGFRP